MADVFNRNEPGFRKFEQRMLEIERARSNGGLRVFIGTRKGRDGLEHRYQCVQCARLDAMPYQSMVSQNLHCPDCEPEAFEGERI